MVNRIAQLAQARNLASNLLHHPDEPDGVVSSSFAILAIQPDSPSGKPDAGRRHILGNSQPIVQQAMYGTYGSEVVVAEYCIRASLQFQQLVHCAGSKLNASLFQLRANRDVLRSKGNVISRQSLFVAVQTPKRMYSSSRRQYALCVAFPSG